MLTTITRHEGLAGVRPRCFNNNVGTELGCWRGVLPIPVSQRITSTSVAQYSQQRQCAPHQLFLCAVPVQLVELLP